MLRSVLVIFAVALAGCGDILGGGNDKFDTTVQAPFVMGMTESHVITGGNSECTRHWSIAGTVVLKYSLESNSGINAKVSIDNAVKNLTSATPGCAAIPSGESVDFGGDVVGTAIDFHFSESHVVTTSTGGSLTDTKSFTGSVINGVATGTLNYTINGSVKPATGTDTQTASGSVVLTFK